MICVVRCSRNDADDDDAPVCPPASVFNYETSSHILETVDCSAVCRQTDRQLDTASSNSLLLFSEMDFAVFLFRLF